MNIDRLHGLLAETTTQFRKGGTIEVRDGATHVFAMTAAADTESGLDMVDLEFILVGVDPAKAALHRDALVGLLRDYPAPERLAAGPSYIEVGAVLGDQGAALQLFALGKVLGLWAVITPATMGFEGDEARELAGRGLVMISGWAGVDQATGEASRA